VTKPRLLCDVDGPVADLTEGFKRWLNTQYPFIPEVKLFTHENCTNFHYSKCEPLAPLQAKIDLDRELELFLGTDEAYEKFVPLTPDAFKALDRLRNVVDVVFVTATLEGAYESYVSKRRWLKRRFPDFPVISCPTGLKQIVGRRGDFAVDDRLETCERWYDAGVEAYVFKCPWSGLPGRLSGWTWGEIVEDFDGYTRK